MAFDSVLEIPPLFPSGVPYSGEPSKSPRGAKLDPERAARILAMADELRSKRDGAERREAAAE